MREEIVPRDHRGQSKRRARYVRSRIILQFQEFGIACETAEANIPSVLILELCKHPACSHSCMTTMRPNAFSRIGNKYVARACGVYA